METPRVPSSDRMRFRSTHPTRWSDEDTQGVINNAVYLTLCEEARRSFFSAAGLLADNRFTFVLAHANVLFKAPERGGVDVVVEGATTHVGTTSFTQAYRLIEPRSGRVLCEVEARLVAWDGARQCKGVFPEAFRRALEGSMPAD